MSEELKPYQPVLVRDDNDDTWRANFFSHLEHYSSNNLVLYVCAGHKWHQCIPYEGNEHLLGTTDSPAQPESEFKFGDKVAFSYDGKDWQRAIYVRKIDGDCPYEVYMQVPWHYGGQEYHAKYCRHEEW